MRIVIAALAGAALSAMPPSARADDVPAFGGAYIGLNAGAAWGASSYATNPNCPYTTFAVFCDAGAVSAINGPAVADSGRGRLSDLGFTGGIQGGYNWQYGRYVVGGEGDFGAFSLGESASRVGVFPSPFLGTTYVLTESMSAGWLATLCGRMGYMVTAELLAYATGGLALTDLKFSSGYSDNAVDATFPGGTGFGSRSVVAGWTLGGGGEWLLDGNWSIKAEYLYVDFGSVNVAVPSSNTPVYTQTVFVDADLSASVARIGINYRP